MNRCFTPQNRSLRRADRGFTLVELLVVIVILGMLMALLLPAVNLVRNRAQTTQCMNRARNIGQAAINYATLKGKFPGYRISQGAGRAAMTWTSALLPDLGRQDIYDSIQASAHGIPTNYPTVEVLVCPADQFKLANDAPLSYAGNSGVPDDPSATPAGSPLDTKDNGVFMEAVVSNRPKEKRSLDSFRDGTQNTLLIAENLAANNWLAGNETTLGILFPPSNDPQAVVNSNPQWAINGSANGSTEIAYDSGPSIPPYTVARPSSNHTGGANVIFAGGNGKFLSENVNFTVYCLIMTPSGSRSINPRTGASLPYQSTVLSEKDLDP